MQRKFLIAAAAIGLLALAGRAAATPIDLTTLQLNGIATAPSANDLNLGTGAGQAASAFIIAPIGSTAAFSGSFHISLTDNGGIDAFGRQADGVSFLIQADPNGATALGGGGGGIGSDGIQNGLGIGFQSWDNDHATIFQTNDVTCSYGAVYCGTKPLGNFSMGLNYDNQIDVAFAYSGGVLSYTATNNFLNGSMTAGTESISDSLAFDISTLGPNVYLGFTGGTGLSWAKQDVSNFDLTTGVPEPASWALMICGFGLAGAALRRRRTVVAA